MAWSIALFVIPSIAYAQKIPDSFVWAASTVLVAPVLAIPIKRFTANLFGIEVAISRLWALCAFDWLLWIPGSYIMFVVIRPAGGAFVLLAVYAFSAWLHSPNKPVGSKLAVGPLLALATPVVALAMSLAILGS